LTRVNLWELLREMHAAGQTIVLTTHYLEEAEALCEQIGIIDHGVMLASGTQDELKAREGGDSVVTLVHEAGSDLSGVLAAAELIPGVNRAEVENETLRVFTTRADVVPVLLRTSLNAGLFVLDVSVRRPSLETVFLTLTGREYRE
jgi:ABC-type multidrug transport system ATPase subunit